MYPKMATGIRNLAASNEAQIRNKTWSGFISEFP
jgi:hypothetical protein